MNKPSVRAQVITRRTYSRPLDDKDEVYETWEQTIDRVIEHQKWLWGRASGLNPDSTGKIGRAHV